MSVNFGRGFFRAWLVLSVVWIGLIGWLEYTNKPWNLNWGPSREGKCWTQLAKWPDGQPFNWFDLDDEVDVASNVELNRKRGAWSADSIPERNKWVAVVRQKLVDCEDAQSLVERLPRQADRFWFSLKNSLTFILLPPLALLVVGWITGWVIRGFYRRADARPIE
jgi:hypothetical protein